MLKQVELTPTDFTNDKVHNINMVACLNAVFNTGDRIVLVFRHSAITGKYHFIKAIKTANGFSASEYLRAFNKYHASVD